jgi:hypothetical protein
VVSPDEGLGAGIAGPGPSARPRGLPADGGSAGREPTGPTDAGTTESEPSGAMAAVVPTAPAGPEAVGGDATPTGVGRRILAWSRWATVLFVVVSVGAAIAPDPLERVSVPVDLVLFAVGCGTFLWAYAVAISRSRYEVITMGGVFFLTGDVAPRAVAIELRVALAVQTVVAVGVAAARPFTALAFSVLVPMFGLGMMALWGARHGTFPSREEPPEAGHEPDKAPGSAQ